MKPDVMFDRFHASPVSRDVFTRVCNLAEKSQANEASRTLTAVKARCGDDFVTGLGYYTCTLEDRAFFVLLPPRTETAVGHVTVRCINLFQATYAPFLWLQAGLQR